MDLSAGVLKGVLRMGCKVPTPIQRKCVCHPFIASHPSRSVRTGVDWSLIHSVSQSVVMGTLVHR